MNLSEALFSPSDSRDLHRSSLVLMSKPPSLIRFQDVDVGVELGVFLPSLHLLILRDPKALVKRISSLELAVHDCEIPPLKDVFLAHEDADAVDVVEGGVADEDLEFQGHLCKIIIVIILLAFQVLDKLIVMDISLRKTFSNS